MSDFLQTMARSSADRAAAIGQAFKSSDFDKPVVPLRLTRFDLIAELKQRSPAEGNLQSYGESYGDRHLNSQSYGESYGDRHLNSRHLNSELDSYGESYGDRHLNSHRVSRVRDYVAGGAAAISVLTEPSRFDGDLAHLEEVVAAVPDTPVMRKDFLVDSSQVLEARKFGASGVLLIAAMLDDAKLREMLDCAWEHGLFVLLESFDEDDLRRSSALLENPTDADKAEAGRLLIGVNTRNLRTLEVEPDRLRALAPNLPNARCVAESGLRTAADARTAASLGYRLALVGTALMRSDKPAALIREMQQSGAAAC